MRRRLILIAFHLLLVHPFSQCASATEWQGSADDWRAALKALGTRALTSAGRPGDPLNIVVVCSENELLRMMAAAKWFPADPITLRSSLRIAVDSVARRPYADAPVSNLFVNGKRQDLAFEQATVNNPSKRHHVRFWRVDWPDPAHRTVWIGAATYDMSIGLSHTNGHFTHHIAGDVDTERDKLLNDIQSVATATIRWIDDFQRDRAGRNGGGDPFFTDGRLAAVAIETSR